MTPAEVLAMRDRLAEEMWEAKLGVCYDDCVSVADWLIDSGWVKVISMQSSGNVQNGV